MPTFYDYHIVLVTKYRKEVYWGMEGIWSEGYFVSTVGVDETYIQGYIKEQGKKDSGQTKFEIS